VDLLDPPTVSLRVVRVEEGASRGMKAFDAGYVSKQFSAVRDKRLPVTGVADGPERTAHGLSEAPVQRAETPILVVGHGAPLDLTHY
jgi:hypothetical protein